MRTSSVTVKGQVVIPFELRRKYGIEAGTRVAFREAGDEIRLVPVTAKSIDDNVGFLGTKGALLRELSREKRREKARER